MEYYSDTTLEGNDFTNLPLPRAEYDNCTFSSCNFKGVDISGIRFIECRFINCDLSNAKAIKTSLQDCVFTGCKMLGFRFDLCDTFAIGFKFTHCTLNHSSFQQLKIKKTQFLNCQLQEVDFAECDLTQSIFSNCDLLRAVFERCVLEQTNFTGSVNLALDPEQNKLKNAIFTTSQLPGLLTRHRIVVEPDL